MPPSSQSGLPSESSPPRRLQSPEERFHIAAPLAPPEPEPAPSAATPISRQKRRHERHHYAREHRAAVRHTRPASQREARLPSANELPVSPTLKRIRANRRRAWKQVAALTVAVLVVGAGVAAFTAPPMNIERVEITGLHATSPLLVRPIAASLLGHNALRANKAAVGREVEALPTVQSARVSLLPALPPRVRLHVVERRPIARVGKGDAWWAVDESGLPYRLANAHDAHLPALTWNEEIHTLRPLDAKAWAAASQLAQAVASQRGGLGNIRQIQLDPSGDAELQIAAPDGAADLTLKLGSDEWPEKLARARVALLYFARTKRSAQELNLISLQLPRWTPRDAGNAAELKPKV